MKGSCTLVASVVAASTAALTSTSSSGDPNVTFHPGSNEEGLGLGRRKGSRQISVGCDKDKFAPRFDGLRFIETLVTAHR